MSEPTDIVAAVRELAGATRQLAEQHERLWMALPPRTRAQLLGISTRAERNRRKKAEIARALGGAA